MKHVCGSEYRMGFLQLHKLLVSPLGSIASLEAGRLRSFLQHGSILERDFPTGISFTRADLPFAPPTRLCCSQSFPALYSTHQLHKQLLPLIMPPPIAPPVQQPADLANIESLIESNTDEISYLKVK